MMRIWCKGVYRQDSVATLTSRTLDCVFRVADGAHARAAITEAADTRLWAIALHADTFVDLPPLIRHG